MSIDDFYENALCLIWAYLFMSLRKRVASGFTVIAFNIMELRKILESWPARVF